MIVLGLDFETTFTDPIDPKKALIVEVGAILWDTERKLPLFMYSNACKWTREHGEFDPRVTALTGLSLEDLNRYGKTRKELLSDLGQLIHESSAIVAHNGTNFDRPVFQAECSRENIPIEAKDWLDTSCDVPYPSHIDTRKLSFLGPAHGFLNPFSHRAVFDVLTMLKVLSFYRIDDVLARSKAEKVVLKAVTQKPWLDGGISNAKAKENGYRYDGSITAWTKTVLKAEVPDELKKLKAVILK